MNPRHLIICIGISLAMLPCLADGGGYRSNFENGAAPSYSSNSAPTAQDQDGWLNGFSLAGQSSDMHVNEGYASSDSTTNGAGNYFFGHDSLYLSDRYDRPHIVAINRKVLVPGTDHMGAGDVYNGKVYAVLGDKGTSYCDKNSSVKHRQVIAIFDGTTLKLEKTADITDDQTDVSGIAIDGDTGEAFVAAFCNNKQKLYAYNLSDWKVSRTIPLKIPVINIQGLAYKQGFLYIADTKGRLFGLNLADNSMRLLLTATMPGEYEGIDFHTGELRWLVNDANGTHTLYRFTPH